MKNVPNILSLIRILLVPIFIVVYFVVSINARLFAAMIYLIASATDVLDGWIARRFDLITNLGRILDPLGDKLMTLAVITCLTLDHRMPPWAILFVAAKEVIMIVGGAIIHKHLHEEMPASNFLGKASTMVLFLVGMSLMLFDIPMDVASLMVTFAICVAFMAFGSYIISFVSVIKNSKNG